jgi:hypothetical protein
MVERATPDAPPLFREAYVEEGDPSAASCRSSPAQL